MAEGRVTSAGVYVEIEGKLVLVTSAGVYTEIRAAKAQVTAAGVYTEIVSPVIRVTSSGLYVEVYELPDGYAALPGYDHDFTFLVSLDPQPRCDGVKVTRRVYGSNRTVRDEALYAELEYDMIETEAQYQAVLSQLGILENEESAVTVFLKNQTQQRKRWNATAVRPDKEWQAFFPRNVKVLIKDLEELS